MKLNRGDIVIYKDSEVVILNDYTDTEGVVYIHFNGKTEVDKVSIEDLKPLDKVYSLVTPGEFFNIPNNSNTI